MNPFLISLEKVFTAQGSDLEPGQVVPRTIIIFVAAIVFVRLAKKRFIAQATAMDLVLAIVFGSVLSRAINGSGTLISCLTAGATLVLLHRLFVHWSAAYPGFERLVKGSCEVLVRDGKPDRAQMKRHDISDEDLVSEMRINALIDDVSRVKKAILERSGQISVVKNSENG